ncbi:MAG: aldo/keto reductase [Phormidesmis sp.]
MRTIRLKSGQSLPSLGMGTWRMGENSKDFDDEVLALRHGLGLGFSLIDTAEMYGEGGAEEVVSEAIKGRRQSVFLVSKVYPHNASRDGAIAACNRTLKRLNTDYLNLYLLHWRGSYPLSETLEAFQQLKQAGKIRDYGVSNFDTDDMEEAMQVPGGDAIATNQVLYNLSRRGIERNLLPWCTQRQMPVMAYSPVEQGRILNNATLKQLAKERDASAAQIAIAWLLQQPNVVIIPKSSRIDHIEQNYAAQHLALSPQELETLEVAFPAPKKSIPLQML